MRRLLQTVRRMALLALVLVTAGCEQRPTPCPPPPQSTRLTAQPGAGESAHLDVLGTLLPARSVQLGFNVGGPVRAVAVQVGVQVRAGDLLADLDTAELDLAVQEAEDGLAVSMALLDQARAGARKEEIAIAEAEYQRALAQHEVLLAGSRPEEIAVAQADREAALAHYGQIASGAGQEELIIAQANVDKAEAALRCAQAAYDLVAGRADVGASPQAAALHEATIDYRAARAQYEWLTSLPMEADLQEARANLARAEAQLARVLAGPSEQEIVASVSSLAIAQAQLMLRQAGPRPEDVAVAEARLQQARTALERARLARSRSELRAPFGGVVSAVYVRPGEWSGQGMPVVELLDTSHWRVETRNVGELDVGQVLIGQQTAVRVLAFRDKELHGRVVAILPNAVVQQGDTTYTVIIELESTDLNVRPGMNVEATIPTK